MVEGLSLAFEGFGLTRMWDIWVTIRLGAFGFRVGFKTSKLKF